MALTIAITRRAVMGDQNVISGTIAFDNAYATGGKSLAPSDLGLRIIDLFIPQSGKSGFAFEYDYTNNKILVYTQGVAHGAAGAVTLDDYPVTAGPGATSGASVSREASATSPVRWGPLKEVANSDDLSTLTGVRFIAYGV